MDESNPSFAAFAEAAKAIPVRYPEKTRAEIAQEIAALVSRKQAAYGDSFNKSGEVMRLLYPGGISLEQMGAALTVVRVIDKLFRIATHKDALGESPWRDIDGYSLLAIERDEKVRPALAAVEEPVDPEWAAADARIRAEGGGA